MFVLPQFKLFSRCYLIKKSITSSKNISRSTCRSTVKDDVYIKRITERMKNSSCSNHHFPLRMDPKYKVAIITGGETGVGLAAAADLLKNEAQNVVLAGVCDGESAVKNLNDEHGEGRACFMHMDVNDPRELEELFYMADMVFGGVDIVFNNAGVMEDHVWEYEVDTNLKSTIRGTLLGIEYMGKKGRGKRKGDGVIINHADTLALDGVPYVPAYSATKAGIIGATLSFGANYHHNQTGVRVVGLLSGPTDTAMIHNAGDKQMDSESGRLLVAYLSEPPPQSPAVVGRAATYLVKYAPPGSLWTINRGPAVVGRAATYLVKYAPPGSLWTINRGELSSTRICSVNTKVTQL